MLAQRYPNHLKELAAAAGYTFEDLAEVTGLSVRSLKGYSRGERSIPHENREKLAPFLHCSLEDLAPIYVYPDMIESGETFWTRAGKETMDKIRRAIVQRFMEAGLALTLAPLSLLDLDRLDRLSQSLVRQVRTDEATLAALEIITTNCWTIYRSTPAKIDLLSEAVGHLQMVTRLLNYPQPTEVERRLWAMVSHITQVLEEIVFDVHEYEQARQYCHLSIYAAQMARQPALHAVALGRLGFLPIARQHFDEAIAPLQEAVRVGQSAMTPTAHSWLLMMQAEAFANLDLADSCKQTIEVAEGILAQATDGEDSLGTGFTRPTLQGYKGNCYLRLGRVEEARSGYQTALQEFAAPTRRRAMLLSDLARTYLSEREIGQACAVATQALDLAEQTRSLRAIERLGTLQRSLLPWNHLQEVRDMNARITFLKQIM